MIESIFQSKDEFRVFLLDVISASPLTAQVNHLQARIDALEVRLELLERRVDALERRLEFLERRLEVLERRMDALERRLENLEAIMLEERVRNEERDAKINAIYDVLTVILDRLERLESVRTDVAVCEQKVELTRKILDEHAQNRKIHLFPKRGRPAKDSIA